ncbi:hypothetical protein [Thalassotalea euphylliae]|uniref:General secretion pathway protein GspM n=1 Tax=Thalassotalea euphylliae TaxID=1655234 RepID=A0A3E0TZY9_9GAMM|nr:hypothetical protein [Thalassotalea euphylliae]REL30228.1 hypothetical protein DXX94_05635 [Thalassotalea euphylliae]
MRELLNNKPLMLGVIAFLAAIKFILLPVLDWQEDKLTSIGVLEERLLKTERLLSNESKMAEAVSSLSVKVGGLDDLLFTQGQDVVQFQLGHQEVIEGLLSENKLSVKRTSWLMPSKTDEYEEHKVEITVSGSFKQLMTSLLAIEGLKPKVALASYTMNISRMKASSLRLGRVSGKITFAVWRKPGGQTSE